MILSGSAGHLPVHCCAWTKFESTQFLMYSVFTYWMRLFIMFAVANKPLDNRYLEREIKQANKWITYSTKEFGLFWMAVTWGAALRLSR